MTSTTYEYDAPGLEEWQREGNGGRSNDERLARALGVFSVGRGKNVTCGSGGIAITSSDSVAASLAAVVEPLRTPGALALVKDALKVAAIAAFVHPSTYWVPAAVPALGLGQTVYPSDIRLHRMSGWQAGLLRHWRERLAESNRLRARAASDLEAQTANRAGGRSTTAKVLLKPGELTFLTKLDLRVDISRHIHRPYTQGPSAGQNFLFDSAQNRVRPLFASELFKRLPTSHRICRIYAHDATYAAELAQALEQISGGAVDDATNM